MTKRRSSLSGRGAEILFGMPPPIEIEPRGPQTAADREAPPEPEPAPEASPSGETIPDDPLFEDKEMEQALFEEAQDGEPGPGREEDLSVLDSEPPPTPEMEVAFVEEAVDAEEPPEPVAEEPVPPLEETMEEIEQSEVEAIYALPPAETSDVASGVLPPRPSLGYFDVAGLDAATAVADVQDNGHDVEFLELSDRELTKEQEAVLLRRMGSVRIKELNDDVTRTYNQVRLKVGDNADIATECYNLLLKARDIILRRDADRFPQAEYYLEQVQARLKRAENSEEGANKYAWKITAWGFLWGALFLTVLILLNFDWFQAYLVPAAAADGSIDTVVFLSSMIWGGVGGVVAVWYSLFKHVGLRDFDAQYNLSYVGKPFLGLVLGATVFMLFHLLLTLGILPAGLQEADGTAVQGVTPWIMYPLAWASGFKENRIFDLVDRVIKRIFSGKEPEPAEPPDMGWEPPE